jgi:predicted lysophospholipase L1 biosynthesis ABC-type transport system permease subunit
VCVEPEPFRIHAAREVNFPHPLEGKLREEGVERLAAVPVVREEVVEVEQEPEVGRLAIRAGRRSSAGARTLRVSAI